MGIFGFGPRDEKWYRSKLEENLIFYAKYVEYAKKFLDRPASPNLSRAIADISRLREKIDSLILEMDPSYRFEYREPSQKKYDYEDLLEKYEYNDWTAKRGLRVAKEHAERIIRKPAVNQNSLRNVMIFFIKLGEQLPDFLKQSGK